MQTGYLKINAVTGESAQPIAGAGVEVRDKAGNILYDLVTDESGLTPVLELDAPDAENSLKPDGGKAYEDYDVTVTRAGFNPIVYRNAEIVATRTALLTAELTPALRNAPAAAREIIIAPPSAAMPTERQLQAGTDTPPGRAGRVLPGVIIPEYMTVHLGTPTNASAANVRVRFIDYIKNVVSSEIYPTWPTSAIIANIHAVVTFAVNRIYTEWYRSRGYNFDITNSTAYDQYFVYGRDIFQNISALVDEYFDDYIKRTGYVNPLFSQYCNGTTATCRGLSQWGTVTLANQGYSPLGILRYYYGNDVTLQSAPVSSATESYPGTALRVGSSGESVRRLQTFLNRIRVNYPAIPAIVNPNGYFGEDTANAVRVFQRVFSLTQDGVAGKATWNKVSQIYAAIIKLSELDGEGEKEGVTQTPPALPVLKRGASGSDVSRLQFLINFASDYYPAVPEISQDGIFGSGTENAVKAFQKQFGLTQDGIVGAATWAKLYDLYNGATGTTPSPSAPAYPGTPLKNGSRSESVRIAQTLLNAAGASLTADGIFGPATESAVKAFQSRNGLTADGIIGPATWSKLTAKSAGTALAAPILPAPVLPIPVRTPAPAPIPTPVLPTPIPAPVAPIRVPYKGTPLREGCKGEEVLWIQRRLNTLKKRFPEIPELLADGRFGEATAAAVKIFQRVSGILSYGIVGSATWRLLNEIGEIID